MNKFSDENLLKQISKGALENAPYTITYDVPQYEVFQIVHTK